MNCSSIHRILGIWTNAWVLFVCKLEEVIRRKAFLVECEGYRVSFRRVKKVGASLDQMYRAKRRPCWEINRPLFKIIVSSLLAKYSTARPRIIKSKPTSSDKPLPWLIFYLQKNAMKVRNINVVKAISQEFQISIHSRYPLFLNSFHLFISVHKTFSTYRASVSNTITVPSSFPPTDTKHFSSAVKEIDCTKTLWRSWRANCLRVAKSHIIT